MRRNCWNFKIFFTTSVFRNWHPSHNLSTVHSYGALVLYLPSINTSILSIASSSLSSSLAAFHFPLHSMSTLARLYTIHMHMISACWRLCAYVLNRYVGVQPRLRRDVGCSNKLSYLFTSTLLSTYKNVHSFKKNVHQNSIFWWTGKTAVKTLIALLLY